jgi:hypothetical protein
MCPSRGSHAFAAASTAGRCRNQAAKAWHPPSYARRSSRWGYPVKHRHKYPLGRGCHAFAGWYRNLVQSEPRESMFDLHLGRMTVTHAFAGLGTDVVSELARESMAPRHPNSGRPPSSVKHRQGIHSERYSWHPFVKSGTRPRPIGRPFHQSATYRIRVDVLDHGPQRGGVGDIAIVAAAPLPEAVMHFAVGLFVSQAFEELRGFPSKERQGRPLHGNLEDCPDQPHFVAQISRANDDVDVFRHDDICPEVQIPPPSGRLQGFEEPLSGTITAE